MVESGLAFQSAVPVSYLIHSEEPIDDMALNYLIVARKKVVSRLYHFVCTSCGRGAATTGAPTTPPFNQDSS